MRRSPPPRLLVLVDATLGPDLRGPGIRGWELARALAEQFPVTVAARNAGTGERDGIRLRPYRRRTLLVEVSRHDVVVATWFPPFLLVALALRSALGVADLYDPHELELEAAGRPSDSVARLTAIQLRHADLLLCAAEGQEAQLRRLAPDASVLVVPMGLPETPARPGSGALRAALPQLGADDVVVVWWGAVWPWLDAETAVEAVATLDGERPAVRLVIAAGDATTGGAWAREGLERVRRRAQALGVLDRTVLVLDRSVPYDERDRLLSSADVGVVLSRPTAEAAVAARARHLDLLWCRVPCVLTSGDELAGRMGRAGFARLVQPGDVAATATALRALRDPAARAQAAAAGDAAAAGLAWRSVAAPVAAAIAETAPRRRTGGQTLRLVADVARYYAGRLTPGSPRAPRRARRASDRGRT